MRISSCNVASCRRALNASSFDRRIQPTVLQSKHVSSVDFELLSARYYKPLEIIARV